MAATIDTYVIAVSVQHFKKGIFPHIRSCTVCAHYSGKPCFAWCGIAHPLASWLASFVSMLWSSPPSIVAGSSLSINSDTDVCMTPELGLSFLPEQRNNREQGLFIKGYMPLSSSFVQQTIIMTHPKNWYASQVSVPCKTLCAASMIALPPFWRCTCSVSTKHILWCATMLHSTRLQSTQFICGLHSKGV